MEIMEEMADWLSIATAAAAKHLTILSIYVDYGLNNWSTYI